MRQTAKASFICIESEVYTPRLVQPRLRILNTERE